MSEESVDRWIVLCFSQGSVLYCTDFTVPTVLTGGKLPYSELRIGGGSHSLVCCDAVGVVELLEVNQY